MSPAAICPHFRAPEEHQTCAAGVNYLALAGGGEFGRILRLPCVPITNRRGETPAQCVKFAEPTPEQIAEQETREAEALDRFRKVMPVVAEWRKKEPLGKAETIACPACGGKLHLSQAACNGHVWGRCETDGCVRWME